MTPLSPSASLVRGAMALLSTQPLTWTASLLTTMLLPRFLGDLGLGQYAVAMTTADLAAVVVALGVPTYLRRRVATQPARAAAHGGGALVLLGGVALLAAAGLSVTLPVLGFLTSQPNALRLALAGMVVATAQGVLFALLIGQERHVRFAWLNAASVVGSALAGIGVLAAGGGVTAYIATLVVTAGGVTALGWRTSGFRLQRRAFDVRHWQELVRGGLPFLGLDVALHIRNQIDVILVGALLSEQAAGWLAAAYRIVSVPAFIPHLIVTPLLPALSRHAERRALFRQTLRHSLAVVIILTVAADAMIIALAPAVPEVLGWGPAFRHAVPLMVIIAITAPLGAAGTVLGTALLALQRERRWLRVTIAGALFNPTMNLVLIPLAARWLDNGAIGAAVAEVGTELVMLGGALFLMPPGMIDRAMAWMGLRVVVAGAGLAVVARVVQPVSLPLAAAAGGTAFLLAAWALRVLRPTDLRTLRDVARESLARRRMIGQDA